MKKDKTRPFVLYVAEKIYLKVSEIKKKNPEITNIEAIERFIGTDLFKEISSGKFHDKWFEELKKNNFIDKNSGKKIPSETIRLLLVQKDTMMRKELLITCGEFVKIMSYGVKKLEIKIKFLLI